MILGEISHNKILPRIEVTGLFPSHAHAFLFFFFFLSGPGSICGEANPRGV